jgi:hypothetical protein
LCLLVSNQEKGTSAKLLGLTTSVVGKTSHQTSV